jgi:WD40 repeat protein
MAGENCISPLSATTSSNNSRTTSVRWLHVVLMFVGLAGWMVFILACIGPAWSPDGSQILFVYRDVGNSRTAVALYDRRTGAVSTILVQPTPGEGGPSLHPTWQTDGTRALVAISSYISGGSSDVAACDLISIPIKSSLPVHVHNLGSTGGCHFPYFQVNGKVYFGGEDLRSVDLETGEVVSGQWKAASQVPKDSGVILSEHKGQIYYTREVTRMVSGADNKQKQEEGSEVGRIQLPDLTLKPSFTLWPQDLAAFGVKGADLMVWPGGTEIAMIGSGEEGESEKILLAEEGKGVVRVLAPESDVKPYKLGNLIWSSDGRTLYASAITGEEKNTLDYWLAEFPLDGSRPHLTKIAHLRSELNDDFQTMFRMSMPVSLSPDGHWIAATPAVLGKDTLDDRDRALFLIDLRDPARPLQRVPIPHQPPAAPPAPKVKQ